MIESLYYKGIMGVLLSMHRKNKGFTLMEMAMVLVSIALLAAAIISAQALIRTSRLVTITADVEIYKDATINFQTKYKYLPGDIPNATTFWGSDVSCPVTPDNDIPKMATCDGNGDAYIGDSNGSAYGNANNWFESFRYWQHLSNSGFIPGNFNGALSSRTEKGVDPGLNIPAGKILGNGYFMLHVIPGLSPGVFNSNYHHVFIYGKPVGPKTSTYGPAILPAEALMLDRKVDDGRPGSGFVLSFTTETEETKDCVTSTTELGSRYNADFDEPACSLIFITGM